MSRPPSGGNTSETSWGRLVPGARRSGPPPQGRARCRRGRTSPGHARTARPGASGERARSSCRLRTWSLTRVADRLAILRRPDSLALIDRPASHSPGASRPIQRDSIVGLFDSGGNPSRLSPAACAGHDSGVPSLIEKIIGRAGTDQRKRRQGGREAAPGMVAVNLGAGPTDVSDDEEPPDDRDQVDRKAKSPERKMAACGSKQAGWKHSAECSSHRRRQTERPRAACAATARAGSVTMR